MAQDNPTKKPDTTAVKTPFKVERSELKGVQWKGKEEMVNAKSDSTKAKIIYNLNAVKSSLDKRNQERREEGKKPITQAEIFGSKRTDVRESNKGGYYKDAKTMKGVMEIAKKKK